MVSESIAQHSSSDNSRQPSALYVLFFTEMWERYGYYTMRAVLVLYMTKVFLLSDDRSYSIFASFTALLYLTPVLGGHFADKLLGFKRSVIIGALFLAVGYALMAIPGEHFTFYAAMGTLIIGSGFFKPNVSGIVGELYETNDPRRDGGFTIFYSGINLGSFLPPLITTWVIMRFGWSCAFLMASVGVVLGLINFVVGLRRYPQLGREPEHGYSPSRSMLYHGLLFVGSIACIFLCAELVKYTRVANMVLFGLGTVFLVYAFLKSFRYHKKQRERLILCHILILFSVLFWALYQQAAMSLTIFTEYNVNRHLGPWQLPTILFQSVNPAMIILLGPFLSRVWIWLDARGRNPSVPCKFALATILMGLGFVMMPLALVFRDANGEINWAWIVFSYFLQTVGELLLSPVGLSMITELSPGRMIGLMMGAWFFASALANSLAGLISEWTTVAGTDSPLQTDPAFAHVFGIMGWVSVGAGVLLLLFVPRLKRLIAD